MSAITKASGVKVGMRKPGRGRLGFTLIEMLVVIGILVILAALLFPVIRSAQRKATQATLASDLQVIGQALEAYRQDFSGYPRPPVSTVTPRPASYTGPLILAWALIGPYNSGTFQAGLSPDVYDGCDGPGFRDRPTGQGPVHGPYLPADKFKLKDYSLKDSDGVTRTFKYILDSQGNPILYFPAKPGRFSLEKTAAMDSNGATIKPNFPKSQATAFVSERTNYVNYSGATDNNGELALYNMDHDIALLKDFTTEPPRLRQTPSDPQYLGGSAGAALTATTVDLAVMRRQIQYRLEQAGEYQGPYLLWSSGADGWWFTDDDATNFGNSGK